MKPRLTHNRVGVRRKPIGSVQHALLRLLLGHEWWYPNCGWVWSTRHDTRGRLDRLVTIGLVKFGPTEVKIPRLGRKPVWETRPAYTLTEEGRRLAGMAFEDTQKVERGS